MFKTLHKCQQFESFGFLYIAGYLETIHRPDNYLILVHVPEILDAERNRK